MTALEAHQPDPRRVEWPRAAEATYDVRQQYSYAYSNSVSDVRQRLVVIPPDQHGDQQLLNFTLEVRGADPSACQVEWQPDPYGNRVCQVVAPSVSHQIEFEARYRVRRVRGRSHPAWPGALAAPFLQPTPLTEPDDHIRSIARAIAQQAHSPLARAERANAWVADAISYQTGVTGVKTAAAQALSLGRGVCQDYAHLLISVLRLLHIPARYVSGHLLGEGVAHAWAEARLPSSEVIAFDPTHRRRAGLDYVTVAVGRDFADVSPTSGVFRGSASSQLSASKRADVLHIRYDRDHDSDCEYHRAAAPQRASQAA